MRRVLLAGATGYIGSRVHRRLLALDGVEVLPISRRGHVSGIRGIDLAADPAGVADLVREFRPDAVVNCAGTISSGIRDSVQAHVVATANLLEAVASNARGARFVQIGSAAEYGQSVPFPEAITEDSWPRPEGPYGVSKLASSQMVVTYGQAAGLDCVVLRVFNLLGADMPPGTVIGRVLAFLADQVADSVAPIRLGRLDVNRDYVDVEDAARAIVTAATQDAVFGGTIVNIGSGEPALVRSVVREILDLAGHHGEVLEVAPGSERSVGVTWQQADITRARDVLGWAPERTRSETLAALVRKRVRIET